jgi:Tn3 transposase DDE domain
VLADNLDAAYRAVSNRLADNNAVRIETVDGHDRPVLTALDKLDEPPSLVTLRTAVDDLLPRVDLPDVLLEVAGWTGFLTDFTHVSDGAARAEDLDVGSCAVLVAEACNIGLEPVVQASNPALSRSRLSWVDQNYIPDGLLEQQTSLQPHELMTDTAGYSDQVFGLFRLLGYQFSPRLADIGAARFWRIHRDADYGPLNGLARHHIDTDLIATHWDDLLRVAGSLAAGTVRASELLRVLQGGGRPTPLGRAVAELAGSPRPSTCSHTSTMRPTDGASSPTSTAPRAATPWPARCSTASAANSSSATAKDKKTNSAPSDSSSTPSWNTRYQDAALTQLRRDGFDVRDDDIQRLSPLGHDHINLLGRSQFSATDLAAGQLRPLRDPTRPDD